MTKQHIALFPLNLVAFPGESINLHIFEERYKQLIRDCQEQNQSFGIPAYINKRIEYGTEVYVSKIVKQYEDGRIDITTQANRIFKVMSFMNPVSGKLYAGGEIFYLDNVDDGIPEMRAEMTALVQELYDAMNIVKKVDIDSDITTFDIGHRIGLSLEQEYELIQLENESQRQAMVINHLKKTIPTLKEVERTKERIRMNGHFKHFDPLDF